MPAIVESQPAHYDRRIKERIIEVEDDSGAGNRGREHLERPFARDAHQFRSGLRIVEPSSRLTDIVLKVCKEEHVRYARYGCPDESRLKAGCLRGRVGQATSSLLPFLLQKRLAQKRGWTLA